MIEYRTAAKKASAGPVAAVLNLSVCASGLAVLIYVTLSNPLDSFQVRGMIFLVAATIIAVALHSVFPGVSSGLLLALIFPLLRPSLLADALPYFFLIPAVTLFAQSGGLRVARWRSYAFVIVIVQFALILPGFVSQRSALGYLAVQAIAATVLVAALLSVRTPRDSARTFIRVIAALLAWQLTSFVISALRSSADASLYLVSTGSRTGWSYSILPGGGVAAVGAGFSADWTRRLTAWFPEPGLVAAAIVVLAMVALALQMRDRWLILLLAVAISFAAQSFGGIAALLLGFAVWLISPRAGSSPSVKSRAGAIVAFGVGAYVLFFASRFGLDVKASSNALSVTDRLGSDNLVDVLFQILTRPLGSGQSGLNAEINLLQSAVVNGLLILLLWSLFYIWFPRAGVGAGPFDGATAALFVTILVAQPPFYEVWIFSASLIACACRAVRPTSVSAKPGVHYVRPPRLRERTNEL